jgi:hypothetical protein
MKEERIRSTSQALKARIMLFSDRVKFFSKRLIDLHFPREIPGDRFWEKESPSLPPDDSLL